MVLYRIYRIIIIKATSYNSYNSYTSYKDRHTPSLGGRVLFLRSNTSLLSLVLGVLQDVEVVLRERVPLCSGLAMPLFRFGEALAYA